MRTVKPVTCPVCGCLCDDLELTIKDEKVVKVKNGCALCKAKFLGYSKHRVLKPLVRKNGRFFEVSYEEAVGRAAEILAEANYPLLYGWSVTSCEAVSAGIELAEEIGGVIDTTSTLCHGPSTLGIQDVGISSATLGQVRHRADLIVYWGSNPLIAHPRHMERYTIFRKGRFQKEKRKLIVVDVRKTETAETADIFLQIKPNMDYEVLQALRALIRDQELDVDEVAGIPTERLEEIADTMVECRFGALFFGSGLTMTRGKNRNIDAVLSLVSDLNKLTKFIAMPMRGHFNVTGADMILTWQTGYPYAVDFSLGYPRYNPGETSAVDILLREESDAALVVASDPVASLPRKAAEHLAENPLIVVDPHMSATARMADVVLPSTFVGIESGGTAYRMDHVPLPLKKIVEPPEGILSDEEILRIILSEVKRKKAEQMENP